MAENVTKTFEESETFNSKSAVSNFVLQVYQMQPVTVNNEQWYKWSWRVSEIKSTASRVIRIDLSDIPSNAVINSVQLSRNVQYEGYSAMGSNWVTIPNTSYEGNINEQIKQYLSEVPRPSDIGISVHISAVLNREGTTTRDYPPQIFQTEDSYVGLKSVKLTLTVNYSVGDENFTVSYGVNNTYQKCNVYYGTGNEWKKCKAYYGSGGQWVECK